MRANELAAMLGRQADAVVRELLPRGKRVGVEWKCGAVSGVPGDSLGVHLAGEKAGVWSDFSTGETGDLIGLWMAVRGLSLRDACREAAAFLGIRDDYPTHAPKPYRVPDKAGVHGLSAEHAAWLREVRKLPDATVAAYRLASRGDRLMFPYLRDGALVFAKYRKLPKQFSAEGGCEPILFGWQALPPNARAVIITEGELDALAWHAYGIDYPALSVPTGATGHAWVESEYARMEPFDVVYLSFDGDAAGQRGARELSGRLGRERCRVVHLPRKDANDCLMGGVGRDVMTLALRDAASIDPDGLRNIGEFEDAIVAEMDHVDDGLLLPWLKTHDRLKLRAGELSVWAGVNGHGKSQVVSHVVANLAMSGTRCCVASMEWPTARWAYRMQRQIGAVERPTPEYSRAITRRLAQTLWVFDVIGSAKAARILEVFRYARRRYGVELFALDNLTKCGFDDDDYSGQKKFVEALADFARETRSHVMLVAHMRKGGTGDTEDRPSGKWGIKGSGGITDMAQTVVEVWRNKPRERAIETAEKTHTPLPPEFAPGNEAGMDEMLFVRKQNETGDEPRYALWFDKRTGQFLGGPDHVARSMLPLAPVQEAAA